MIVLREAEERDIRAILEIWSDFLEIYLTQVPFIRLKEDALATFAREITQAIQGSESLVLVAVERGTVVGFARGKVQRHPGPFHPRPIGFVEEVVIRPSHRGRGVGKRLVEELLLWFREQECGSVQVTLPEGLPALEVFWRRFGFSPAFRVFILPLGE